MIEIAVQNELKQPFLSISDQRNNLSDNAPLVNFRGIEPFNWPAYHPDVHLSVEREATGAEELKIGKLEE